MTKYYAVHTKEYWGKISKNKYMTNDEKQSKFSMHYNWMKNETIKRLENYDGENLLWWWKDSIPDTDDFPWNGNDKIEMVLLEVELENNETLDSNYYLWDLFCIGDKPLPDYDEYETFFDNDYNDLSFEEMSCNWDKIFDRHWYKNHPVFEDMESEINNIQSITGKIETSRIKVIKIFTPITYNEWLND